MVGEPSGSVASAWHMGCSGLPSPHPASVSCLMAFSPLQADDKLRDLCGGGSPPPCPDHLLHGRHLPPGKRGSLPGCQSPGCHPWQKGVLVELDFLSDL